MLIFINMEKKEEKVLEKEMKNLGVSGSGKKEGKDVDEEMEFMNECLAKSKNKLNISMNEKDELDDLDDEKIEQEFNDFLKSFSQNQQAKVVFN